MQQIKKIGIVGSGKMGSDIFNFLSDFDFHLIWFSLFDDEKEKLEKSFHKKISRQLKHGIITQDQFDFRSAFLITNSLADFSDCDLVIESIVEELDEKKELFKKLELFVKKDCMLTSNSSSILPSVLTHKIPVVGLHFFYPVALKNVVELIIHDALLDDTIQCVRSFLHSIHKVIIVQEESKSFLLNRFLLEVQVKALDLALKYHISFRQMDQISNRIIPDFGLFEMMDHVGLNTMYNSVRNYRDLCEDKDHFNLILRELKNNIEMNSGFYQFEIDEVLTRETEDEIFHILKQEISNMEEMFIRKYEVDKENFRIYLNDFCGIVL